MEPARPASLEPRTVRSRNGGWPASLAPCCCQPRRRSATSCMSSLWCACHRHPDPQGEIWDLQVDGSSDFSWSSAPSCAQLGTRRRLVCDIQQASLVSVAPGFKQSSSEKGRSGAQGNSTTGAAASGRSPFPSQETRALPAVTPRAYDLPGSLDPPQGLHGVLRSCLVTSRTESCRSLWHRDGYSKLPSISEARVFLGEASCVGGPPNLIPPPPQSCLAPVGIGSRLSGHSVGEYATRWVSGPSRG